MNPEPDLRDEEHSVGARKASVGREVVLDVPENLAAALAKAIVDAAFRYCCDCCSFSCW